MPYLEWDENDFPILKQTDDDLREPDYQESESIPGDDMYSHVSLREAALQSALEFHACQLEEGSISVDQVLETANRFVEYLRSGKSY